MITLADPETCRQCGQRGRIVESRKCQGYRRRRHFCEQCQRKWTSFQSFINPRKVRVITRTHEAEKPN